MFSSPSEREGGRDGGKGGSEDAVGVTVSVCGVCQHVCVEWSLQNLGKKAPRFSSRRVRRDLITVIFPLT